MLFGRKRQSDPIAEFWTWWPSLRPRLTADIDAGHGGASLADEISQRVAAIHGKLDWELGKGTVARHAFTLSPVGDATLRATAARWLALAPPVDGTWEFHDARQPNPSFDGTNLRIGEHDLALGDLQFGLTPHEHRVDVTVFHPLFGSIPDNTRLQITFLALDWALGENGVEVWVGEIAPATTAPARPSTVEGLRTAVAELVARHSQSPWAMLEGERQGKPLLAVAQVPLRSARWPRFDTHVALSLPFADRGNGLPTGDALQALRDFEDSLAPILGVDGALLAHETSNGVRTLHYYVDGETEAPRRLAQAASAWRHGRSGTTHDPSLKAVRHLDGSR